MDQPYPNDVSYTDADQYTLIEQPVVFYYLIYQSCKLYSYNRIHNDDMITLF